jgi:hypothetical protein
LWPIRQRYPDGADQRRDNRSGYDDHADHDDHDDHERN